MQQSSNIQRFNSSRKKKQPASQKDNICSHDSSLGNSEKLNKDRLEKIKPLKPLNKLQATYLSYLEDSLDSKVIIATGWPGCVDKDTEFLTTTGWKKISEYQEGDLVGQSDHKGIVSFVKPLNYIKEKCDSFYYINSTRKNQMLSIDHKVAYKNQESDQEFKKITVKELLETENFNGIFKNSFKFSTYKSCPYTDEQIRISTLLNIFGNETTNKDEYEILTTATSTEEEQWSFILNLLHDCNYTSKNTELGNLITIKYTPIPFSDFQYLDKNVAISVLDTIRIWSPTSATINTKCNADADALQFLANSMGLSARVYSSTITFSTDNSLPLLEVNEKFEKIDSVDGFKYCFEVPTNLLVLRRKGCIFITGNSSKTYLPTAFACQELLYNRVSQIVFSRPAISNSKSLGFFSGDKNEKMEVWLAPVLSVVKEQLGTNITEIAIKREQIVFYPLEVIKGLSLKSLNPNSRIFYIVDEAEDLSRDEIIKIVTRIGKNCTLVLAGDITQSELKESSGLKWLIEHIATHEIKNFYHVDFNDPEHIVRDPLVKNFIKSLYFGKNKK